MATGDDGSRCATPRRRLVRGGWGGGDVHTDRGGRRQSCGGAQRDCGGSLAMARQRRQLCGGSLVPLPSARRQRGGGAQRNGGGSLAAAAWPRQLGGGAAAAAAR
jgi:hypothetical protein